jgi:nucleotide-binding universal stress UspA family protein
MSSPIIVGVALRDDDAAPLTFARRLAEVGDTPLVLATALPREAPARFPTPEYSRAMREQAAERLTALAQELGARVPVRTRILDGSPAGELHELAEVLDAAAIVVGSSHRGAIGRLLIGDVGVGLLHGSTRPVAIVPRDYDARPHGLSHIGVAFDGTRESRAALDAGIGLARRLGGDVHAITVLEPLQWAPAYAWPGPYPSDELTESRAEWAQTVADRALEAIPETLTGTSEVMHGAAVPALAGASTELDLLVCGSRGYGSAHQVLAGSVARGLAHDAACPLLVVPREPAPAGASLWRQVDDVVETN